MYVNLCVDPLHVADGTSATAAVRVSRSLEVSAPAPDVQRLRRRWRRRGALEPAALGAAVRLQLGSASGDDHTRLSPSMPASAATASANFLPSSYWRSFTSKPSSRSMMRCGAERLRRRRSIASRRLLVVGDHLGGDHVHHVLGVPLDDRHGRLNLIHQCPLLRALHERGEPTLAERLHQPRGIRQRRQPARRAALDPHLERRDVLGAAARSCARAATARPGTGRRA